MIMITDARMIAKKTTAKKINNIKIDMPRIKIKTDKPRIQCINKKNQKMKAVQLRFPFIELKGKRNTIMMKKDMTSTKRNTIMMRNMIVMKRNTMLMKSTRETNIVSLGKPKSRREITKQITKQRKEAVTKATKTTKSLTPHSLTSQIGMRKKVRKMERKAMIHKRSTMISVRMSSNGTRMKSTRMTTTTNRTPIQVPKMPLVLTVFQGQTTRCHRRTMPWDQ
jgi:hypothetical protein